MNGRNSSEDDAIQSVGCSVASRSHCWANQQWPPKWMKGRHVTFRTEGVIFCRVRCADQKLFKKSQPLRETTVCSEGVLETACLDSKLWLELTWGGHQWLWSAQRTL